jgi:hypothetical protein
LNLSVVMATFRNHSEHGDAGYDAGPAVWFPQACTFVASTSTGQKYTQKCLIWRELEKRSAEMEIIRLMMRPFLLCHYHNYYYDTATGSLNISVGIATRLRAGRQRNWGSIPDRVMKVSFRPDRHWSPPCNRELGLLFSGSKRPDSKDDHSRLFYSCFNKFGRRAWKRNK